ncbi:hypothetical protein ACOMHN_013810 [Nucella lapillus]
MSQNDATTTTTTSKQSYSMSQNEATTTTSKQSYSMSQNEATTTTTSKQSYSMSQNEATTTTTTSKQSYSMSQNEATTTTTTSKQSYSMSQNEATTSTTTSKQSYSMSQNEATTTTTTTTTSKQSYSMSQNEATTTTTSKQSYSMSQNEATTTTTTTTSKQSYSMSQNEATTTSKQSYSMSQNEATTTTTTSKQSYSMSQNEATTTTTTSKQSYSMSQNEATTTTTTTSKQSYSMSQNEATTTTTSKQSYSMSQNEATTTTTTTSKQSYSMSQNEATTTTTTTSKQSYSMSQNEATTTTTTTSKQSYSMSQNEATTTTTTRSKQSYSMSQNEATTTTTTRSKQSYSMSQNEATTTTTTRSKQSYSMSQNEATTTTTRSKQSYSMSQNEATTTTTTRSKQSYSMSQNEATTTTTTSKQSYSMSQNEATTTTTTSKQSYSMSQNEATTTTTTRSKQSYSMSQNEATTTTTTRSKQSYSMSQNEATTTTRSKQSYSMSQNEATTTTTTRSKQSYSIQVQFSSGKMIPASKFGKDDSSTQELTLTTEEEGMATTLKDVWKGILSLDVEDTTDFFKAGAGSMDVVRLVEEVREKCNDIRLQTEDVYMNTVFEDFFQCVVRRGRGIEDKEPFTFDAVKLTKNNMELTLPHQVFIDNQFMDASNGDTYNTINPTDESVICQVSKATVEDVNRAVEAAKEAFEEGEWGRMNARDKGALMYRLADLMEQHAEELATIEAIDSGAVYTLALKTHVGMSIQTFRYFAGWCDKIQGLTIPINNARPSKNLTYTKREPIGVCGIVVPWNYPLMMLAWKMAACLAAGNTVVLKPAQVTPLTALKFAELSVEAGFPPGVINILPGSGSVVGQAFSEHPDIRKLGFTGSTPIGKTIMESCAKANLKKVSLELGGKSPLIIFADCDMEKAVRMGMSSVFFNKGENCIAAGRLFVEESVHDEFLERILVEVSKMKVGDPLDRSTDHGPQNHRAHMEKLVEFCDIGVQQGATLVKGGKQVDRPGLFFAPTVFTDVEDHMMIAEEESFGPVMIISKFADGDVEGVLRRANNTEFGLASGVFSKDIDKALHVADSLQAGTVFINTYNKTDVAAPFGGFKQSGFGKDLGQEALLEYLKTKSVTVEYN